MKKMLIFLFLLIVPISVFAQEYSGNIEPLSFTSAGSYEITLNNVIIDATGKQSPGIEIGPGVNLTIKLVGDNRVIGDKGLAGILVSPDYDTDWMLTSNSAHLNIIGSGNLDVTGGSGDTLTGLYGGGAGIGGNGQDINGDGVDFGYINISSTFTGTITSVGGATAKYLSNNKSFGAGSGIGTGGLNNDGFNWGEVQGIINIAGGVIDSTGGEDDGNGYGGASGIGSGGAHGNGQIASSIETTISGGKVTAKGTVAAAGIGGGSTVDGGTINISGGEVIANSGDNDGGMCGAGIGGGDSGTIKEINITGGKVIAKSKVVAGIGGGSNTNYSLSYNEIDGNIGYISKINISGNDTYVEAYGGSYTSSSNYFGGPGIGSGYSSGVNNTRSLAYDITITDGATVYAYGGQCSNSIGYGCRWRKETPTNPDPILVTGYGIKLTLGDTINLFANNSDDTQTPLVSETEYDNSPINYVSEDNYLITMLEEGKFKVYSPVSKTYLIASGSINNGVLELEVDNENLTIPIPDSYNSSLFTLLYNVPKEEDNNEENEISKPVIKDDSFDETNPETYDGIILYIILFGLSLSLILTNMYRKSIRS